MPRYWKQVRIEDWIYRLNEVMTRGGTPNFSIVYRFYSTEYGYVRYVGRSDNPFSRETGHYHQIGIYGIHKRLGGRISYVDFTYFTERDRFKRSYEEECRQYHRYQPDLNTVHPATHRKSWRCPICE